MTATTKIVRPRPGQVWSFDDGGRRDTILKVWRVSTGRWLIQGGLIYRMSKRTTSMWVRWAS